MPGKLRLSARPSRRRDLGFSVSPRTCGDDPGSQGVFHLSASINFFGEMCANSVEPRLVFSSGSGVMGPAGERPSLDIVARGPKGAGQIGIQ
jgi:hypothetical protein